MCASHRFFNICPQDNGHDPFIDSETVQCISFCCAHVPERTGYSLDYDQPIRSNLQLGSTEYTEPLITVLKIDNCTEVRVSLCRYSTRDCSIY